MEYLLVAAAVIVVLLLLSYGVVVYVVARYTELDYAPRRSRRRRADR